MSFNDVRDLAEHLKLLGFPHGFSQQTLASKHGILSSFYIVAEILCWLSGLLDIDALLPSRVSTEDERVQLIRSATEFFVTKSAIRLNPCKLYSASLITAAELQKITRLLIVPTYSETEKESEEQNFYSLNQIDIGDKMEKLRRARELSSDLTQRGATLYDLLSKEMLNKEEHLAHTNRSMELVLVERNLKNAIAATQVRLQRSRTQLENSRVELNALNSKLQRKLTELDRTKQRLEALQKIRPAHMQEYEDCEKELQHLFQKYFLRVHIRDALTSQVVMRTKSASPVSNSLLIQKPLESSIQFIPDDLIDDDNDDVGEVLMGTSENGIGDNMLSNFNLDAEILSIRDEDMMRRKHRSTAANNTGNNKPTITSTSRLRPTTGRSRKTNTSSGQSGNINERNDHASKMLNARAAMSGGGSNDDDDSTFGSSESDLNVGEIMSIGGLGMSITSGGESGGVLTLNTDVIADDDFDPNSMDDISITKLTGELPLRPKTAGKPEHHSDEDF